MSTSRPPRHPRANLGLKIDIAKNYISPPVNVNTFAFSPSDNVAQVGEEIVDSKTGITYVLKKRLDELPEGDYDTKNGRSVYIATAKNNNHSSDEVVIKIHRVFSRPSLYDIEIVKYLRHPFLNAAKSVFIHNHPKRLAEVVTVFEKAQDDWFNIFLRNGGGGKDQSGDPFNKWIPLLSIRDMFGQLLEAVEYMHNLGFIHLDIKIENVLVYPTVVNGNINRNNSTNQYSSKIKTPVSLSLSSLSAEEEASLFGYSPTDTNTATPYPSSSPNSYSLSAGSREEEEEEGEGSKTPSSKRYRSVSYNEVYRNNSNNTGTETETRKKSKDMQHISSFKNDKNGSNEKNVDIDFYSYPPPFIVKLSDFDSARYVGDEDLFSDQEQARSYGSFLPPEYARSSRIRRKSVLSENEVLATKGDDSFGMGVLLARMICLQNPIGYDINNNPISMHKNTRELADRIDTFANLRVDKIQNSNEKARALMDITKSSFMYTIIRDTILKLCDVNPLQRLTITDALQIWIKNAGYKLSSLDDDYSKYTEFQKLDVPKSITIKGGLVARTYSLIKMKSDMIVRRDSETNKSIVMGQESNSSLPAKLVLIPEGGFDSIDTKRDIKYISNIAQETIVGDPKEVTQKQKERINKLRKETLKSFINMMINYDFMAVTYFTAVHLFDSVAYAILSKRDILSNSDMVVDRMTQKMWVACFSMCASLFDMQSTKSEMHWKSNLKSTSKIFGDLITPELSLDDYVDIESIKKTIVVVMDTPLMLPTFLESCSKVKDARVALLMTLDYRYSMRMSNVSNGQIKCNFSGDFISEMNFEDKWIKTHKNDKEIPNTRMLLSVLISKNDL